MSMNVALVFPHQLYREHPAVKEVDQVILIEDYLFFTQFKFHKQKLILHRASMKFYETHLNHKNIEVKYIEFHQHKNLNEVLGQLKDIGASKLHYADTTDDWLERKITAAAKAHELILEKHETPGFLTPLDVLQVMMPKKKSGYFMASFYQKQRIRMDVLMDGKGEPLGGKWSFDEENRKKLPKNIEVPPIYQPEENDFIKEAKKYIHKYFDGNYGEIGEILYPTTFEEADTWLEDFLLRRMQLFGDYEDALAKGQNVIFHSLLTAPLNIGLLTPQQILNRTFELHSAHDFPLNSLEGFVRQIIGWREFMRGIYEFEGSFERTNNHWGHTRKIPESFWSGNTGIVPVDNVIQKVLRNGYSHHIERLMVMGNFMLLCEFDPDDVYRWFMELYIDAYDWVMVPNVYGMTQYADGGLITTKPYISGSNYIKKMSDFEKGEWTEIWDALYWRFIHVHRVEFAKNQRMSMMVRLVEKMDPEKLNAHLNRADSFLKKLAEV